MRSVGRKIKDLRTSLSMRQNEFAKAIGGVDQSTVSKWENGRQRPEAEHVLRIARLANITPQQFLGIPDITQNPSNVRTVTVTGDLQAGAWRESSDWPEDDQYEVPAPLGQDWADFPIHARLVTGPSMNRVYPEGTVVYIAPIDALGRMPKNGERVAVRRVDAAGNYESTLKEYVVAEDGRKWLYPRSYDPEHQAPLQYADKTRGTQHVSIVGIVVAALILESNRLG